ncbi:class I SAM-dependent methyltransferase [Trinickia fusca]|uniref:Class I SAM-dependent methyltransferase n=1 Tax=Trinickia fusca TaxID=2419777 RepID=A0A494X6M4_9BURK|nr:class I SAM-dependent methyltransferase [Trinickia fusca]RKP46070.1 class I SAM-dependent methyltransferase [Trinickia fusca]
MSTFSQTELYLQDFHERVAGATSAAFAGFPAKTTSREYRSSYDVLASLALETPLAKTVLDVACGDGHLLRLLADSSRPLQLIGVDMSQGELDIAKATLPDHVLLLKERAQEMSIATGSVDVVLSHMALMLMDEIEQVLREIHRVLAPGGTLATIVGRTFLLGEANEVLLEIFRPIAKESLPPLAFGDHRTGTIEGWTELLQVDFDDLHFEDVDVPWNPTPQELWNSLVETYDVDRLPDDARHRLKDQLIPALSRLQDTDGTIRTGWGIRLVQARVR